MKTFSSEISDLVHASVHAREPLRNIEIAIEYFGWDGQGGTSMQAVGNKHGITRERVRQITNKIVSHMRPGKDRLTVLPHLLNLIYSLAPANAERIEQLISDQGLNGERIEGVLHAAKHLNMPGQELRITEVNGVRFVVLPDMDNVVDKVTSLAQRYTSHVGLFHLDDLLEALPAIPKTNAYAFLRDVLVLRDDLVWLDEAREWGWIKDTPRNRLVTCLSKMLSLYASTTLHDIREGAERYYRKGSKKPPRISAPDAVLRSFIEKWGMAKVSAAGIVRKSNLFVPDILPLEMEESIARYILSTPSKVVREKELESTFAPAQDGEIHPKKYNFSIALNYSPLIKKGPKRGQYVASGSL